MSPLRTDFLFPIALWYSGSKSHCFSRPDTWVLIFLAWIPRLGVPHVGLKSLIPRDELCIMRSLPAVGDYAWGGVSCKTMPLSPLHVSLWPFIRCCGGTGQLHFLSYFEGSVASMPVDLLCYWDEVSSGSFYTANPPLPLVFKC